MNQVQSTQEFFVTNPNYHSKTSSVQKEQQLDFEVELQKESINIENTIQIEQFQKESQKENVNIENTVQTEQTGNFFLQENTGDLVTNKTLPNISYESNLNALEKLEETHQNASQNPNSDNSLKHLNLEDVTLKDKDFISHTKQEKNNISENQNNPQIRFKQDISSNNKSEVSLDQNIHSSTSTDIVYPSENSALVGKVNISQTKIQDTQLTDISQKPIQLTDFFNQLENTESSLLTKTLSTPKNSENQSLQSTVQKNLDASLQQTIHLNETKLPLSESKIVQNQSLQLAIQKKLDDSLQQTTHLNETKPPLPLFKTVSGESKTITKNPFLSHIGDESSKNVSLHSQKTSVYEESLIEGVSFTKHASKENSSKENVSKNDLQITSKYFVPQHTEQDSKKVSHHENIMNPTSVIAKENQSIPQSLMNHKVTDSAILQNTDIQVDEIVGKVKVMVNSKKNEMVMQLKPEHLGKLEFRLIRQGDQMQGNIFVESIQAKEVLESQMTQLYDRFEKQGLQLERIHINVQQAESTTFSSQNGTSFAFNEKGHETLKQSEMSENNTLNNQEIEDTEDQIDRLHPINSHINNLNIYI